MTTSTAIAELIARGFTKIASEFPDEAERAHAAARAMAAKLPTSLPASTEPVHVYRPAGGDPA